MKKNLRASVIRDLAMALIMLWAFAQALIMTFADADSRVAYLVMILAMDAVTLLAISGRVSVGTVLSGTLTCLWLAVKLYNYYAVGELIHPLDYAFIVLPLLGALAAGVFNKGVQSMDTENTLLHRQVEELVLVDEVTGLYNQRALYRDLRIMVHYCDRNHLPISLMLVQMRYGTELEGILSRRQYLELRQRLAELAQNNIRVEDRAYCIDEQGTIALLLTTSEQDSGIVRGRLQDALKKTKSFQGILDEGVQLDMRFACKQYEEERYGNDMVAFKRAVESELVYDV